MVDDAGVDRFALMAMSQGGPVAIAYAARHPERVTRLMFYGSYAAAFRDPTPEELELERGVRADDQGGLGAARLGRSGGCSRR